MKKNGKIVFTSGSEGTTSIEGTVDVSGKNLEKQQVLLKSSEKIKVGNSKIDAAGSSGGEMYMWVVVGKEQR